MPKESSTLEENGSSDRKSLIEQQEVKIGGDVAGSGESSPRASVEECCGYEKDGRTRVRKQEGVERLGNVFGGDDGEVMLNDNNAESVPHHNAVTIKGVDHRGTDLNDDNGEGDGQAKQIAVHHKPGQETSFAKRAAFNQATHKAIAQFLTSTNGQGDDPQESSSSSTTIPSPAGTSASSILPAKITSKPPSPCHVGGISSIPVASFESSKIGDSRDETSRRQRLPVSARR